MPQPDIDSDSVISQTGSRPIHTSGEEFTPPTCQSAPCALDIKVEIYKVTDCGNLERLSVAIRFVDGDWQIREEFLGFIIVERITGAALSTALSLLEEHEIDIT